MFVLTEGAATSNAPDIVNTRVSLEVDIQCLGGYILGIKLSRDQFIHFKFAEVIGEDQYAIVSEFGH